MSASTVATEAANNKVLPGDTTGLPWEVWQIILSWLSAADLCHVSCVCKTWVELVASIDSTHWKELYLSCSEWHHPFWPLNTQAEPPSWRLAYRDQYISTKFWCQRHRRETQHVSCTALFMKNVLHKSIHIGPGLEHESLKTALSTANDYDRIIMHPGIYDEQCEILAKVPFELVGYGELGSVILNVGVKQLSTSTRLSSLVLRAPWFTSFILNINSGYLQIDNCILEDGIVCARNPSTVHIKFCTFRHASIILQHMNVSIIENCEFSQSGSANIFVEGHPKEDKNWTYSFLKNHTDAFFHQERSLDLKKHGLKATSSVTSTVQSSFTNKSHITRQLYDTTSHDATFSFDGPGGSSYNSCLPQSHHHVLERDGYEGLVGCEDLQSVYQDTVIKQQITTTSAVQTAPVTTGKQDSENEKLKINCCECTNNTFVSASEPHVCNENCNNCTKAENSFKNCNNEDEKLSMPNLGSLKNQSNYKTTEHSSMKKSDRHKSVDSHIGFDIVDKEDSSHHTSEICRCCGQQKIVSSHTGRLPVLPSNIETNNGKLPPISKSPKIKTSNRGNRSAAFFEVKNQDEHGSSFVDNEHVKGLEIGQKTNPDNLCRSVDNLGEKQNICRSVDNLGEKQNMCISKVNMNLQCQDLHSNFDLNVTKKSGNVSTLNVMKNTGTSNQSSSDLSISLSHNNSSGTENIQINNCRQHYACCVNYVESNALFASAESNSCKKNQSASFQSLEAPCNEHPCGSVNHCIPYDVLEHPIRRSQSDDVLIESDEDLSILDEIGDSSGSNEIESDVYESSSQTTDSNDVESPHFTDTDEEFSSSEDSVIMLPHLSEFHMNNLNDSLYSNCVDAEITSVNSDSVKTLPVNIMEDTLMRSYAAQVHGCLIRQCRMNHSKGGIMISLQAHVIISECDISDVRYGIRCIQNSRVFYLLNLNMTYLLSSIFDRTRNLINLHRDQGSLENILLDVPLGCYIKNEISHCQTSGIFMRLAASGLIAGNDIHSNNEAGIDIRKSADPLVQFNKIHHGKRSGIVVLGSGHGQIIKNDIYSNTEAGIYVLYGGNPIIRENYIYGGQAAGVAINAGGRGYIVDNVIKGNHWAGIDIRNGSCSLVSGNSVINGNSDGIVIGVNGKGSIESNLINGNAGCGILMMATENLNIHGNQICNNGHCGLMMLDKTLCMDQLLADVSHRTFSQCSERIPFLEPSNKFALLQYNDIYNNKGDGIFVEINQEVRVLYNTVHANHKNGIHMAHNAPSIIEANSITNNRGSGIVTSTFHKSTLIGNGIYDNEKHGVICRNNCVLDNNDIVGHPLCAVLVQGKDPVQLTHNRLSSSNMAAVKGEELCIITAENNKICNAGGGDFNCSGNLIVTENILITLNLTSRKPSKIEFNKTNFLTNPPQRPHIPQPPQPTLIPTHQVALVTKVSATPSDTCEQGSKLCTIL